MAEPSRLHNGAVLIAIAAVIGVIALAAGLFFLLPVRSVSGQVIDGLTGRPLAGVAVSTGGRQSQTDADGAFSISGARLGGVLEVAARGYLSVSAIVGLDQRVLLSLNPRVLEGSVADAASGKPVAGAQLSANTLTADSDGEGKFRIVSIEPGTSVVARAAGFMPATLRYDGQPAADLKLVPAFLKITAVNQYTGRPVDGADVTGGRAGGHTDAAGTAKVEYVDEGAEIQVRKEGFSPAKLSYSGQEAAEVRLRPDTISGTVKGADGKPLPGATVTDGNSSVTTGQDGAFRLSGLAEGAKLLITATGRERKQVDIAGLESVDVTLKPFQARGTYLTYYGVGDDSLRGQMMSLADKTEVNAVVIDVKGDFGLLAYKSSVPMVKAIGAQAGITIPDPGKLLSDMKKKGIYTIARIVVFKDKPLATARPDLAVANAATGAPWTDNEGLNWADPTREEVWDYNIALAVEAIKYGFDEVQFDYVRFPSDASAGNSLDSIRFSKPNTEANRMAAINGFLEKAAKAIHAAGGAISADVFGYVVWRNDDLGIGQNLEEVAKRVDYVSPMIYPNLFWDGIEVDGALKYGGRKAGLYPYEIVNESMKIAVRRVGAAKLRPWLEYYNDYITGKEYGPPEMALQKKATYDTGVYTWLFWDPTNRFAKGGFEPK